MMISERRVSTLRQGDPFRDWLVDVLGERIRDKGCNVAVYRIRPSSHTVCRYEFRGESLSVVAKFYAEPTGWHKSYDPVKAMQREFDILRNVGKIICVPRPIAIRRDFHCVLVTEHVLGSPLFKFMRTEIGLYDKLTAIAHALRRLHDHTRSSYKKQDEFAHFHHVLDQLRLDSRRRQKFNQLLGAWWHSTLIDLPYGCRIHSDPNPVNFVFDDGKVCLLDFESSWEHANFVHDLGIVASELKHYFARHKSNDQIAEPYIGHFLWHYSRNLEEFRGITRALPFFMSLGLLRMARLGIDSSYIFREAPACLGAIFK